MLNLFKTIDLSAYSLCPQFTLKFMGLYGSISDFRLSKAYSYQRDTDKFRKTKYCISPD